MAAREGAQLTAAVSRGAGVLYLSHNGLTEPLGRRQVLPYLVGLAARGWRMTVLSFEKPETASPEAMARVEGVVREADIVWRPLRYHNRPPVAATIFDVLQGWRLGRNLVRNIELVHARSTVPALMARLVSGRFGTPWVFDLRGLLAEEYVDAGHWPRGGARHRGTAAGAARRLGSAHGLVTLTRRVVDRLPKPVGPEPRPTAVIPCSVDLNVFRPSETSRREVRAELGWGEEPVIVYAGSLGSWYRLEEMFDFFEIARREIAGLRFLVLTPQIAMAEDALRARQLAGAAVARSVLPDAVPRHLAAGDAGICFLGDHPSKMASSPTKYGEYLATGLPVVTNAWTGDAARLSVERAWITIEDFGRVEHARAAGALAEILRDPNQAVADARDLAYREFSLDVAISRYDSLYREVLERWQKPGV